jgi:hypothetical protein
LGLAVDAAITLAHRQVAAIRATADSRANVGRLQVDDSRC